ncbi:MAG TPA: protein-glutamate O-methyltransferase CheR, partial [Gemmatimonadaceae bacterium]|nr:protein-glutamate O-methyltransferase CheR [Gemmatimonadaceae bacterium]
MKRLEAGSAQQELLAADAMLELVREQSGLTFSGDRRKHALEVARRAIRRVETMAGALDARVGSGREAPLLEALVAELTVGETYFFREPEQLRFIRDSVLPALASRKGDGAVHVWSAGCATGEEPYSIAILLHELGLMPRASIVGTDISRERLAIAARGRYGAWSLRGVPSDVVRRHFDERDGRLTLKADRRRPVRFTPLNLAAAVCAPGVTHGTMDLVLCRNVLIYFDRPTIERVARLLLGSLSEDGWLFLGASDPLLTEMLP